MKCPHCDEDLDEGSLLWYRVQDSYISACNHCLKVLGAGSRSGLQVPDERNTNQLICPACEQLCYPQYGKKNHTVYWRCDRCSANLGCSMV